MTSLPHVCLGRKDLAAKVEWVADRVGDGFGYDIVSFADDGTPVFIEVKTTKGPITTPFFVTENERRVAAEKRDTFRIYRLFGFGTDSKVYRISEPLETSLLPAHYFRLSEKYPRKAPSPSRRIGRCSELSMCSQPNRN